MGLWQNRRAVMRDGRREICGRRRILRLMGESPNPGLLSAWYHGPERATRPCKGLLGLGRAGGRRNEARLSAQGADTALAMRLAG